MSPVIDAPPDTLTDEQTDLLSSMENLDSWKWKKTLGGGYSSADLFLAWVTYKPGVPCLEVFKFDRLSRSKKERRNWERHVKSKLDRANVAPLTDWIEGASLGLNVYACSSFDGHLETFEEFYSRTYDPERTIQYLFETVLHPWYQYSRVDTNNKLAKLLKETVGRVRRNAAGLFPGLITDIEKPWFQVPSLGLTLPNPLHLQHVPTGPVAAIAQ